MKLIFAVAPLIFAALSAGERAEAADAVGECISASTDGQTLRKDGKLLAAHDRLVACERLSCPAVVRTHCAHWLAELDPLIPSVVVRAQDARGVDLIDARVAIDGKPVKLDGNVVQLDPGDHSVVVEPRAGGRKEQKILLASGEHARLVVVRFDPAPPPASSARATPQDPDDAPPSHHVAVGAWVLGGVGLAAAGVGTYLVLAAVGDRNHLAATCAPYCSSAATQPGRTDILAGDVLLGVGGVSFVGALVWAFAFPESTEAATATWRPRVDVHPVARGALTGLTFRW